LKKKRHSKGCFAEFEKQLFQHGSVGIAIESLYESGLTCSKISDENRFEHNLQEMA